MKYTDLDEVITVMVPLLTCSKCLVYTLRVDLKEEELALRSAQRVGWTLNPPVCPNCNKNN